MNNKIKRQSHSLPVVAVLTDVSVCLLLESQAEVNLFKLIYDLVSQCLLGRGKIRGQCY